MLMSSIPCSLLVVVFEGESMICRTQDIEIEPKHFDVITWSRIETLPHFWLLRILDTYTTAALFCLTSIMGSPLGFRAGSGILTSILVHRTSLLKSLATIYCVGGFDKWKWWGFTLPKGPTLLSLASNLPTYLQTLKCHASTRRL